MNVAIIIVNWNGKSDTLACLASLAKLRTSAMSYEIIVVDNASTDDSVASIKKKFPRVTILGSTENLGFTGGNNKGLLYAKEKGFDAYWILNNDTVVHPEALTALVTRTEDPAVGIVGSKIYFAAGHEFHVARYKKSEQGKVIWYAGGQIDWANMYASHRGVDEVDHGQYDTAAQTAFVTGCSLLITSAVLEKVGMFDDAFYLYMEDLDYSLRAERAGYELWYEPASVVWHVNAGSTAKPGHGLQQYYMTRNRLKIGFAYASLRTKVALMRESVRLLATGTQAQKQGIRDAVLCRFGNRYSWKV